MTVIKGQMHELELADRCEYCYNGEEAFLKFKQIVLEATSNESGWSAAIMPVCLLLLDF